MGGLPSEFRASIGRAGALIEQEGFGEVVAEAGPRLAAVSMSSATVEYIPLPMT
jgi:hypothetical protein